MITLATVRAGMTADTRALVDARGARSLMVAALTSYMQICAATAQQAQLWRDVGVLVDLDGNQVADVQMMSLAVQAMVPEVSIPSVTSGNTRDGTQPDHHQDGPEVQFDREDQIEWLTIRTQSGQWYQQWVPEGFDGWDVDSGGRL